MYLKKRIYLSACLNYCRLWGRRPIYITVEGLYSPEATPNLDVVYRGPNHITIYLPYLSHCPLATSKTLCSIPIFKTNAYEVIIYALCPYREPKMVSKETLFWLNKTIFVYLAKR